MTSKDEKFYAFYDENKVLIALTQVKGRALKILFKSAREKGITFSLYKKSLIKELYQKESTERLNRVLDGQFTSRIYTRDELGE